MLTRGRAGCDAPAGPPRARRLRSIHTARPPAVASSAAGSGMPQARGHAPTVCHGSQRTACRCDPGSPTPATTPPAIAPTGGDEESVPDVLAGQGGRGAIEASSYPCTRPGHAGSRPLGLAALPWHAGRPATAADCTLSVRLVGMGPHSCGLPATSLHQPAKGMCNGGMPCCAQPLQPLHRPRGTHTGGEGRQGGTCSQRGEVGERPGTSPLRWNGAHEIVIVQEQENQQRKGARLRPAGGQRACHGGVNRESD